VDELCREILTRLRTQLQGRSFSDLIHNYAIDFAAYVGFTGQTNVANEAFAFASGRAGKRWKLDGSLPRGTHVLAKVAQPGKKTHYTRKECRDVLGMGYLVVYESPVKHNAFAVEAELQRALQHIPLGRRLWRQVGMGQNKPDTLPGDVLYKVFFTYSFKVQAAIKSKTCIVRR
jgi:hypothetical protein